MFISVEELQDHRVKFDETFAPGQIEFATEGIEQVAPIQVTGSANLLVDEIELRGRLKTLVETNCARCLEPVRQPVDMEFNLVYRPISSVRSGDEFQVPRGEEEIGFYHGDGLLLEDVAREQVLLALPMRLICQSDCHGLCPHCGKNLNQEMCDCAEKPVDPRWQGLRGRKNN